MDASLVMFGIEAGAKLGRKLHDVLIDATVERPLLLPVGDLFADVEKLDAVEFFQDNPELTASGGPYHGFSQANLLHAYRSLLVIDEHLSGDVQAAIEIVGNLNRLEQYKRGFGAKPGLQRVLGTIVEIGVDYFVAHPEALGKDSNARHIVEAFVEALDEADFAEGTRREIVGDLLGAALRTLDTNLALIEDDERTQALLGGVTKALLDDLDALKEAGASVGKQVRREELLRRIGSSVLRGAAGAFSENISLFLRKDDTAKALVQSTLSQVLAGIERKEDLFTNESLELVYKSALNAVGDNAELLSGQPVVQSMISRTVAALTSAQGKKLFSGETVSAIVQAGLEVLRDNAEALFDPENPQEQLLASTVGAMARSLASSLAGGGTAKDLLSKTQLVDLTRALFEAVARNPEQLIGARADDEKMTALAQIVGSVARALGEDPSRLLRGEGLIHLVRESVDVALLNADKLIDFESPNTSRNLLFKVLREVVVVVDEGLDERGLLTRDVFLEVVERILPLVSANLEPLLDGHEGLVGDTLRKALALASDSLADRTNGANLPVLIEDLLRRALWNELNLDEDTAVVRAAMEALRLAA